MSVCKMLCYKIIFQTHAPSLLCFGILCSIVTAQLVGVVLYFTMPTRGGAYPISKHAYEKEIQQDIHDAGKD